MLMVTFQAVTAIACCLTDVKIVFRSLDLLLYDRDAPTWCDPVWRVRV